MSPLPDFRSTGFLIEHVRSILTFYYPQCIDQEKGGYFQHFDATGKVSLENHQRHLVSSSRLTINFAVAAKQFNDQAFLDAARHGLAFLRDGHRNPETGGYAWMLENGQISDGDNHCYGFAFVLMAYARTYEAGAKEAYDYIDETFQFMEKHFWQEQDKLYIEVIDAKLKSASLYRGQNSNMHCCEALIAAYEATKERRYLDRALVIARRITVELAAQCDGKIWEHYNDHWLVDFEYNAGDTENKLRPWGYQPGHFTEWAKLLLLLNKHTLEGWLLPRAKALFDNAMEVAFDTNNCGLFYGFAPSGEICSNSKYSWVQAETIVAAALLASQKENHLYWCIYHQFWQYAWTHMIDHEQKCWHRNLTHDNKTIEASGVSMGRTDYHSICACIEIIHLLSQDENTKKDSQGSIL
ncbi:N-acylglucosamine 2-epimerase [Paremcibacter congregatus]|uniref:N-acylglucosamine 2-epimerase n=2 Tax=Paremcibacter congregatus TaxID=2043170 RepID=A0A2G4YRZ4_9PROT|nr:N-acylglucosamine 2-epimerase [Paremcibacter congregatus]QDE29273.1 AGE family epimerase/isomerase [Paremcibacter congregatus]